MLSLDQVAVALSVSRRTVESYVASGKLRAVRLSKRCVRVNQAHLEAFLAARETGA